MNDASERIDSGLKLFGIPVMIDEQLNPRTVRLEMRKGRAVECLASDTKTFESALGHMADKPK